MAEADLILVHGLYSRGAQPGFLSRRARAAREYGGRLGVLSYSCTVTGNRPLANWLLRRGRGTLRAVDAAEVFELDAGAFRKALETDEGRAAFRSLAGCDSDRLDPAKCFTIVGTPRRLLRGERSGQRVLWFGRGLARLTDTEFAEHYTLRHGPLVARHARLIGLKQYTQVVASESELYERLLALGLGRAPAPVVFAELIVAPSKPALRDLREWRAAVRAIKADEQSHVDFRRSMLLLG